MNNETCTSVLAGLRDDEAGRRRFAETVRSRMPRPAPAVVVADDEPVFRRRVARAILHYEPGARILEAADGRQALEQVGLARRLCGGDPALIVLDLDMPVMDGWTVLETLRHAYRAERRAAGIPVIVMSSTNGERMGPWFRRQSVHWDRTRYDPAVSVAKEECLTKDLYDAVGEPGLLGWLEYFLHG
jgi:CheY-like chemotaxis protein